MNIKALLPRFQSKRLLPSLDALALIGWGALLLKYWLTGQLKLLIHPNYFILVFLTSLILFLLGIFRIWHLLREFRQETPIPSRDSLQHITLLPPGWSSGLLVLTALLGLFVSPTLLTSQIALQRGVSESLPLTRIQPQSFRTTTKPEDRSLIDWVRTLNVYPEPDAYSGQKAKVSGFVVHLPQLPENYLLLSRFIITCCAVDAYPVGLPVKLDRGRTSYPPDTWLEIEGEMMTETLSVDPQQMTGTQSEKRQLIIAANSVKPIPVPADPYGY